MRLQEFTFNLVGTELNELVLDSFEREIGGVIDRGYRAFLLDVNGGVPHPELISSLRELAFLIGVFYGLSEGYGGLRRAFFDLAERRAEDRDTAKLLPIASDSGDQDICIVVGVDCSPVFTVPAGSFDDTERPVDVVRVAGSFAAFVESLSQPSVTPAEVERLAQRSWKDVYEYLCAGGDIDAKSPGGLSLLCHSIRCGNDAVFEGLVASGADLTDALRIAVTNKRLDVVKRLVDLGSDPGTGLPFAVGPKRKEIRAFLTRSD